MTDKARAAPNYAEQWLDGDRRPIPDPTVLTTQALQREVLAIRELFDTRLTAMDKAVTLLQAIIDKSPSIAELHAKHEQKFLSMDQRFADRDKAIELVQRVADKQSETIVSSVDSLKNLHDERFNSIQTQFTERDIRTEQTSRDSKVAVDAALQAAKEAVGEQNKSSALAIAKSEASTTKQIDQIVTLITSGQKALDDKITSGQKASDDKIDDIKTRLTTIEGKQSGKGEQQEQQHSSLGTIIASLAVFLSLAALVVGIIVAFKH